MEPTRKLVLNIKEESHHWVCSVSQSVNDKCIEASLPPARHSRAQSVDLNSIDAVSSNKHRTSRSVYRPILWKKSLPFHSPPSRGKLVLSSKVRRTPEVTVKENKTLPSIFTMTQSRTRLPFASVPQQPYAKIRRPSQEEVTKAPLNPRLPREGDLKQQFDKMWAREVRLLSKK
jgi:hypothetical protein